MKKERLVIIWGIIFLVFLVCLTLVLLLIKFYILSDADYQKSVLQQNQQKSQTSNLKALNEEIKKYNSILIQLNSFYNNEKYFNKALDVLLNVPSPEGLVFTNFSLNRDSIGNIYVSVSGVSDTRDDLLIFKNNIEANPEIKGPSFSQESWINPKNADFSLTFEISQDKNQNEKQK